MLNEPLLAFLKAILVFSTLEMHCLQQEISLSLTFFQNFIFFPEGSPEYVMTDHGLLNISTVTGKWFRKFVFNFNLTGVYEQRTDNIQSRGVQSFVKLKGNATLTHIVLQSEELYKPCILIQI